MEKILFSRHLNEIDDLRAYERDAPLMNSEENQRRLNEIADAVYEKVMKERKKAVLFITSPRVRAKQTAELVADSIKVKTGTSIKFRFSVNENLRSTEQGKFILPKNYKAGEQFPALQLAGKIFNRETHASDQSGMLDNIDYRFGDPVKLADGQYKYPELAGHFTQYGESYKETLIRIYSAVLNTSKKYERFLGNTEVVVVSHGQIYHVLRGLSEIARMIKKEGLAYRKGDSVKLLWDIYKKCSDEEKVPGICMPLDFSLLDDKNILCLLQEEINFFKAANSTE